MNSYTGRWLQLRFYVSAFPLNLVSVLRNPSPFNHPTSVRMYRPLLTLGMLWCCGHSQPNWWASPTGWEQPHRLCVESACRGSVRFPRHTSPPCSRWSRSLLKHGLQLKTTSGASDQPTGQGKHLFLCCILRICTEEWTHTHRRFASLSFKFPLILLLEEPSLNDSPSLGWINTSLMRPYIPLKMLYVEQAPQSFLWIKSLVAPFSIEIKFI